MKTLLFVVFLSLIFSVQSQDFEIVPKQKTIEIGTSYVFHSGFEKTAAFSEGASFDIAWLVSGFQNKRKVFISIPLGFYRGAAAGSDTVSTSRIFYGWTIRHELRKDKKMIPFLAYGLLLNQLWLSNTEGHGMGHETRFDVGTDFKLSGVKVFTMHLSYSHATFPAFGETESKTMDFLSLIAGLRF